MEAPPHKIIMCNLPDGTMKSDVTDILKGWIETIEILFVDLVVAGRGKSPINNRKTWTAYVQLPSKEDCDSIVEFYNEKFKDEGFAYQNNFGYYEMVKVQHYTRKHNDSFPKVSLLTEVEESWCLSDNDDNIENKLIDICFDEKPVFGLPYTLPQVNEVIKKIIIHQLPMGVSKEEVSDLIRSWKPGISIKSIDIAPPAGKRDRMNAYIALEKVDCDFIVHFHAQSYPDGFWFFSNAGGARSIKVTHYTGKKKGHSNRQATKKLSNFMKNYTQLVINCIPSNTEKEEIINLIKTWNPDLDEFEIHYQSNKSRAFLRNLPIQLLDGLYQHFVENFQDDGGYNFVNNAGVFGVIQLEMQHQRKKGSEGSESEYVVDKPERDIVAEISKAWGDDSFPLECGDDDVIDREYFDNTCSAQNETCRKVDSYDRFASVKDQSQKRLFSSVQASCNEVEGSCSNTRASNDPHVELKSSPSQHGRSSSNSLVLKRIVDTNLHSPSSLGHDVSDFKGIQNENDDALLSDNDATELNELLKEKKTWTTMKLKTKRYNKVLEDTLREKESEFFVSEVEYVNLENEVQTLKTKLERLNASKEKDAKELEELKENLKYLK